MSGKIDSKAYVQRLRGSVRRALDRADPLGLLKTKGSDEAYEPIIRALTERLKRPRVKPTVDKVAAMAQNAFEEMTSEESRVGKVLDYTLIATLILQGLDTPE